MTQHCYQDAFEFLLENQDLILCHGYPRLQCTGPLNGKLFGHAWLETGMLVFDAVKKVLVAKPIYYAAGEIDETLVTRYEYVEAVEMVHHNKHYGPWENVPEEALFDEGK